MNKEVRIPEKIKDFIQSQGPDFEYNETAIEQEYEKETSDPSNLATKILSVAGGFLSTLAFLGFLLTAGILQSGISLLVAGFLFIGFSIWINLAFNKLIFDTLSVSSYAIGYCLLGLGLNELQAGDNSIGLVFMIIAAISLYLTQAFILSFISVLILNGSLVFLIVNNDFFNILQILTALLLIVVAFMFQHESWFFKRGKKISALYNPLRIAFLISFLIGCFFIQKGALLDFHLTYTWSLSLLTIPLNLYLISIILQTIGVKDLKIKVFIYIFSALILLPTALAPAISGSLLLILLCFRVAYKFGFSVSIIAFIYFLSQYYYDLNFTLLTKSILLFSSGILFLIFSAITYKYLNSNEKI